MSSLLPALIWDGPTFAARLMEALDEAYVSLSATPSFRQKWVAGRALPHTKTAFRQSPMLGTGGSGRDKSGLVTFAKSYILEETKVEPPDRDRWSFERYQDFALYSAGDWYAGAKVPLLLVECESNSKELLGELAGLLTVRCPVKYLFIDGSDTQARLDAFCSSHPSNAIDWEGTVIHIVEVPEEPSLPSGWRRFHAEAVMTGKPIRFHRVV